MRALLIAEKPPLMKDLKAVYDKYGHKDEIVFKTFVGHTMTLQEPQDYKEEWGKWDLSVLPMIPERFLYKPTKDKAKLYKELKDEIKNGNYDYIINACDPGREGQHIFFSFYESIGAKLPVKRLWTRDLTEQEVKRAFNELRDETEPDLMNMTIASKYRAYFDWLVGLNGTRAVTLGANKKINVGRVMTPVLKILVDRELELRNFVPKPFWEIEANFGVYKGIHFFIDEESEEENGIETRFFSEEKAEDQRKKFGKQGTVLDVQKKKESKYAPPLHSLQELSNEATLAFGYTMAETLEIAQSLYEKKILSYPRTDSKFITTAIAKEFTKHLKSVLYVPELKDKATEIINDSALLSTVAKNKKYVDDSKVTDHYAIIPTGEKVNVAGLSEKERNIFALVCRRFLAIFLPPMTTNTTAIITESNGYKFKTTGSVLLDLGFMELYEYKGNDNVLPDVKKGEVYDLKQSKLIRKETTPPKRYNDATLGKAMENAGRFVEDEELSNVLKQVEGLGRPATRGGIVEKLVYLKMIDRRGSGKVKAFYATDFGIEIIEGLRGKDITLPELTATWEQKLTQIEEGNYQPQQFYDEMIRYAHAMMEDFKNTKVAISNTSDKEVLGKCPKCSGVVVEGKSYYLCGNYKKSCEFILGKEVYGAKLSKAEVKKLLQGKATKELELTTKSGEKRKAKLILNEQGKLVTEGSSSSSTSSKKTASSSSVNSSGSGEKKIIGKCVKCSHNVIEGSKYYQCEKYRDSCDFIQNKEIKGTLISAKNMKAILDGKMTEELEFTWASGKTGKARLQWKDNKIDWVFSK